jgi:hypothetical protein
VAAYLAAEQDAGRVVGAVDPRAAALLLLGACQMTAFLESFTDGPAPDDSVHDPATAAGLARAAVRGLLPRGS